MNGILIRQQENLFGLAIEAIIQEQATLISLTPRVGIMDHMLALITIVLMYPLPQMKMEIYM